MKYTVEPNKFGNSQSLVERYRQTESGISKFNIKVRKSDLAVIDRLAELSGRSRAYILNDLVQMSLVEMLKAMREDDEDFAALLALYVDKKCGKSEASIDGWSAELFGVQSYAAQNYWVQREIQGDEPSDKYQELLRRIKAVKK